MSKVLIPGQPREFNMADFDTMGAGDRLSALRAGFHDLHRRLAAQEATNRALTAQVNVVFELWAVVSTLVENGPGRGRHGMRHFLGRLEDAKHAIRAVAAGKLPREKSAAHRLLDEVKGMDERFLKTIEAAAKAAKQKAEDDLVTTVAKETRAAFEKEKGGVIEPGVLLGMALEARADMGGEPLVRVRVEFEPTDAHRLALASEGFVLEGPGSETLGSVLLRRSS